MNYKIITKKLGHYWYVDIDHVDANDIFLGEKISRILNVLDKQHLGTLEFDLIETYSLVHDNTIWFDESDLLKYFTTDASFSMHFTFQDIEFSISSELYGLLESVYNPNFHKTLYNLEIYNCTV